MWVLAAVIVALCAFHWWCARGWAAERAVLVGAVLARHAGEFTPYVAKPRTKEPKIRDGRDIAPNEDEMIGVGGL